MWSFYPQKTVFQQCGSPCGCGSTYYMVKNFAPYMSIYMPIFIEFETPHPSEPNLGHILILGILGFSSRKWSQHDFHPHRWYTILVCIPMFLWYIKHNDRLLQWCIGLRKKIRGTAWTSHYDILAGKHRLLDVSARRRIVDIMYQFLNYSASDYWQFATIKV